MFKNEIGLYGEMINANTSMYTSCPSAFPLMSDAERRNVQDLLNSPQFVDRAPAQIHAALLDQGIYHCSSRTMYRILHDNLEVREPRDQVQHPHYYKPELIASGPARPERFVSGLPTQKMAPETVWINPPITVPLTPTDKLTRNNKKILNTH